MGLLIGLGGALVSGCIEQRRDVFPFKEEDWLRYLLPAKYVTSGRKTILLTGPSTVRENLRYERFAEAFPGYDVIQGGISLGTMEDVNLSLEYIREVYGVAALPDVIVLGVSPRFIANIPEGRPFRLGINRYSPHFSITFDGSQRHLTPKARLDGAVARLRFVIEKGPDRLRSAILTSSYRWLTEHPRLVASLDTLLGRAGFFKEGLLSHMGWRSSPYQYRAPPMEVEALERWLDAPDSWWRRVFDWDPAHDSSQVQQRFARFMEIVRQHDISVVIVNMPELDILRERFNPEYYDAYLKEVRSVNETAAFIDLRDYLTSAEFWDAEHALPDGSSRMTDEIIRHLQECLGIRHRSLASNGPTTICSLE